MSQVSIVMTTYNRPTLLGFTLLSILHQKFQDYEIVVVDDGDDELTSKICNAYELDGYPIKCLKLDRPKSETYRNQARPLNVGLRRATGDIVILQNAECAHIDPETIAKLTTKVTETNAVFARVTALEPNGAQGILYCGVGNARPYFFCGAIKRAWFEKLRGFDEDFIGYGYEDDDFASRLNKEGVTWEFTDVEVHHQWHPLAGRLDMDSRLYEQKMAALNAGTLGTVRNLDREWGML
jgi:glycosyltransferase involved in cell wall biosynthesis